MMRNFNHILILFFISIFISCYSQNCETLNENFSSYEDALSVVKRTKFYFEDKCNTSKSDWIKGAEFYSCDNLKGYFFISIRNTNYIHKDMPKEVWEEFKKSDSFGSFYNKRIKGKYKLII
tara:strand:- start:232 stop:594 length:363 start_codon:yes stop_codon:yes gene_type:complete